MQAIEFETFIKQRAIKLPLKFEELNNVKVKVIILIDENQTGNYDKKSLFAAFSEAKENKLFSHIANTVDWQKQIRDEWE